MKNLRQIQLSITLPRHKKYTRIAWLSACFLTISHLSYSQCSAAPIAPAACAGGNGAATNGGNLNGGTYWFTGGPTTFGSLNLNGGILRVCGNLTVSAFNYNGGNIIVESGGSLKITGSASVSGVTIINRGTLAITGSLTLQGSNNYLYNDLTTSVLTISGTLTLNGTTSYLINRGIMTTNTLSIQGATGEVCIQDNSILNVTNLNNNATGSISYSGIGQPACLNVSTSAFFNNDLTSSSKIHICTNTTPTGGASGDATHGWGTGTVYNGCTSCAVALVLNITRFTATLQGSSVGLQWTVSQDLVGNEVFYIEKSVDGIEFSNLTALRAIPGQLSYAVTDPSVTNPKLYYRLRAVNPTGASYYSQIVLLQTDPTASGRLQVYPNPVRPHGSITLVIPSSASATVRISLVDMEGRAVRTRTASLLKGSNRLSWDLQELVAGIYTVRVEGGGNGALYSRISVQAE